MDVKVYQLNPGMAEDYIRYFDGRAFADGNPERGCYCVWHHWTQRQEEERSLLPEHERPHCKRDYARALIEQGTLNGFAAYADGQMVGFCNADNREHYFRLSRENRPEIWEKTLPGEKVLSIVCYIVAPDLRRRGIAKALLAHACHYAAENGFDYVEGYPAQGTFTPRDCGGSAAMYREQGFEIIDIPGGVVARKRVSTPSTR